MYPNSSIGYSIATGSPSDIEILTDVDKAVAFVKKFKNFTPKESAIVLEVSISTNSFAFTSLSVVGLN